MADVDDIRKDLGELKMGLALVAQRVVRYDERNGTDWPERISNTIRPIAQTIVPEMTFAAGGVPVLPDGWTPNRAVVDGQVDTEDLANALLNVLRPEIVELARQGVTIDPDDIAERVAAEVRKIGVEEAEATAQALRGRLAG